MQKNESGGMGEFKRAKPKPVPENWQEEAEKILQEHDAYFTSDEYKNLDDPRKHETGWTLGHKDVPRVYFNNEQYLSFFETFISTPQVLRPN